MLSLAHLGLVLAIGVAQPPESSSIGTAAAPAAPTTQPQNPAKALLKILLDEHYEQAMADSPTTATLRGDDRYNGNLEDVSPEAVARRRERWRSRLERLDGLDQSGLNDNERLDASLLRLELAMAIEAARFFPEQMPMDNRHGPSLSLPQMPDNQRFAREKDYADFAERLAAVPALIDQHIANMRAGLTAGRVPPRVVMDRTPAQAFALASAEVAADPTRSLFYRPFLARPADDPAATRAREVIAEGIVPAYQRLGEFLRDEYLPRCRETIGASDGVDGRAYYEHRLRRETTTALSAEEIHRIGVAEVARIRAEMFAVIEKIDFPGKQGLSGDDLFRAFVQHLRTNPAYYHTSEKELLREYREIAKRIDGELPALFGKLPRNPYGVREMPRFIAESSPTAYYYPGSIKSGVAGFFVANTYRLDQRPRYEMIALTLHEAMPGHHLQIALADEMEDQHPFRTLQGYNIFVEGWGLYAERLGLEMAGAPRRRESEGGPGGTGLFSSPVDDFGRLSYEMWRACRLVVDPGIHAMGWTRQRAIDFMLANSALSPLNIEREVDRYIAWPGQACAYKIGELKIRDLRAKAERALGERFDIRAFHDVVLGAGAIPLEALTRRVEAWVESRRQ